jgi:hypothetical protein
MESPPVVVNGTSTSTVVTPPMNQEDASFRERVARMTQQHFGGPQEPAGAGSRLSPSARQRLGNRQAPSAAIAPLDLAMGEFKFGDHPLVTDLQHLSPVYETLTPSPTAVRKFEGPFRFEKPSAQNTPSKEPRSETSRPVTEEGEGSSVSSREPTKSRAQSQPRPGSALSGPSPSKNASPVQAQASTPQNAGGPASQAKLNGVRENGSIARGPKSDGVGHQDVSGGWQKAVRHRKKGGGDGKGQLNGHASSHAENPPRHDAERKGG